MSQPETPQANAHRTDPALLAAARMRVALANRRGANRLAGVAPSGRIAGRLAQGLPQLPADTDMHDPLLVMLLDDALAEQVQQTAAAALIGHDLALSITPQDRAAADAMIAPPARAFALRHRHLSAPVGNGDLAALLRAARAQVRAAWLHALPGPLAAEFGPAPAPHTPDDATLEPVPKPAPDHARTRLWQPRPGRRRRPVVLGPGPALPAAADRPLAALMAALHSQPRETQPPEATP